MDKSAKAKLTNSSICKIDTLPNIQDLTDEPHPEQVLAKRARERRPPQQEALQVRSLRLFVRDEVKHEHSQKDPSGIIGSVFNDFIIGFSSPMRTKLRDWLACGLVPT